MTVRPPLHIRRLCTLTFLLSLKPCLLTDRTRSRPRRNPHLARVCKVLSFSLGNHMIRQQHTKDLPSRICRRSQHPPPYRDQLIVGVVLTLAEVRNVPTTAQGDHTYREHLRSVSLFTSNQPPRLTRWNLIGPCEFISSRATRPKCASTAELFGHLPGYLQHAHTPPQEEEDGNDDRDDHDEGAFTQDVLSPLKKRQRKKIRESAGVKPKPPTKRSAGPLIPKLKPALPPVGRVRCLWGGDCTVQMTFDYTLDTIKGWRNHIASHLTKYTEPTEDPAGKYQRTVKCCWGGCSAKVERGYLFKHIVTHEVRFKLLCPRGCGVAFRDDNLERHLRSCPLGDQ